MRLRRLLAWIPLLALLAHGTISYEEAMSQSPEPEDLSLKLRKMFPSIEERGGELTGEAAAVLGNHLFEAQEWSRALKYLLEAADSAWTLYKSEEAAILLDRAADASERSGEPLSTTMTSSTTSLGMSA